MTFQSQEELDAALAYWQKRLRLQDWDVAAKIKRVKDMDMERCQACVTSITTKKRADIDLIDPLDYSQASETRPQDHEKSLVHELLHLYTGEITQLLDDEAKDRCHVAEEQLVDLLACAFVDLKRQIRPADGTVST